VAKLLMRTPIELEGHTHPSLVDLYLKTVKKNTKGVSNGPSHVLSILSAPEQDLRGCIITRKLSLALDVLKYFGLAFFFGPQVRRSLQQMAFMKLCLTNTV
jgi:hypothetical protein